MPLIIDRLKHSIQSFRQKQADRKGTHNHHQVETSKNARQLSGNQQSHTSRPENTPVEQRHTEKTEHPQITLNVVVEESETDHSPVSPHDLPPSYNETMGIVEDIKELSKQAVEANKKLERRLKKTTAQAKKITDLEQQLQSQETKLHAAAKRPEQTKKIQNKIQEIKTRLQEAETVQTRYMTKEEEARQRATIFENALLKNPEADKNADHPKHKSKLAGLIKPFLTLNKEEVTEREQAKKLAAKGFKKASESLKIAESTHKKLEAKKNKTTRKTRRSPSGTQPETGLDTQLQQAKQQLGQATGIFQRAQQEFLQAEQALKEAEKNTDELVNSATDILMSLREMHSLAKKDTPLARRKLDEIRTIQIPRMAIDTEDGRVEVKELQIKLKPLQFKPGTDGKMIPVLGVEKLSGQITIPMADQETMNVRLNAEDIELEMDSNLGPAIHQYVTSEYGLVGFAELAGTLLHGNLKPRSLAVRGNKLHAHLDGLSAKTLAATIHTSQATPVSVPDLFFETLGVKAHLELEDLSVDSQGEVEVSAKMSNSVLDFEPEPTIQHQKTAIHRGISFNASKGSVTVNNGIKLVDQLTRQLEMEDPLTLIPGFSSAKEKLSGSEMGDLSKKLTLEVTAPKLALSRELKRTVVASKWGGLKKKKKWTLTGANTISLDTEVLEIRNTGNLPGSLSLEKLHAQAKPYSEQGVSVEASASRGLLEVDSPTGLLPEEMSLSGAAKVSLTSPSIKGTVSEDNKTVSLDVSQMSVSASKNLQLKYAGAGITLPRNTHMTAQGSIRVKSSEDGTFITPELSLQASNKVFVSVNDKTMPVNIDAAIEVKAPCHILSRTDDTSATNVVTPVITQGELVVKAPKMHPLEVSEIRLSIDPMANGTIRANGIKMDLSSLTGEEEWQFVRGKEHDEEDMLVEKTAKAPWYLKPLLANRSVQLSVETPISGGKASLARLKASRLEFTSHPKAGPVGRMVTGLMNLGSRLALNVIQQSTFSYREIQETVDGKQVTKTIPFVTISIGPIKRALPLKAIPAHVIDPASDSINIKKFAHETTGLLITSQAEFNQTVAGLAKVRSGDSQGIAELSDMCDALQQSPTGEESIHLIGAQFPVEQARQILETTPEKEQSTIKNQLNTCIERFLPYPKLLGTAIQLMQMTGYQATPGLISEMEETVNRDKQADPAALAILLEQQNSTDKARSMYELALKRKLSVPLAHARLGCIYLAQAKQKPIKKTSLANDAIKKAMTHLLKGSLEGHPQAREALKQSETSKYSKIADQAKLYNAVYLFKTEESPEQFYQAIANLEYLFQHSTDHELQGQALRLLENRCKNAQHIFHTEDEELFAKTQKEVRQFKENLKSKKMPEGQKAYDLGIKLLYGAAGAPCDLNSARKLLNEAAKNLPAARAHLAAIKFE